MAIIDNTFTMLPNILKAMGTVQERELYLILADKINRRPETQKTQLLKRRRPPLETTVGQFQCVTGYSELADLLTEALGKLISKPIAPSTIGNMLKDLETMGIIKRETLYYPTTNPREHGGEAGTRITLTFERERYKSVNVDNSQLPPRTADTETDNRKHSQKTQKTEEIQAFEHSAENTVSGTIIDIDLLSKNVVIDSQTVERAEHRTNPQATEPQQKEQSSEGRQNETPTATGTPRPSGKWYDRPPTWYSELDLAPEEWKRFRDLASDPSRRIREQGAREIITECVQAGFDYTEMDYRIRNKYPKP